MKKYLVKGFTVMAAVMFLSITVMELTAHARAGGSRSSGSSGSRSYSRPASPSSQPRRSNRLPLHQAPFTATGWRRFHEEHGRWDDGRDAGEHVVQQLCRSRDRHGSAAQVAAIGLFEIILLAGLGYLIYRFVKKKRAENSSLALARGGVSRRGTGVFPQALY